MCLSKEEQPAFLCPHWLGFLTHLMEIGFIIHPTPRSLGSSHGCPCGYEGGASLWSGVSRFSGWLVQSQGGVCPLPLGDSPAEAAGREITSQWKDGSWPSGLNQELLFFPLSVLDHCPVSSWAEGPSVFVRKGAGSVSLQGRLGPAKRKGGEGWGPQGRAALVWREDPG